MDLFAKLLQYRVLFIAAIAISLISAFSFTSILSYFLPLFLSTTVLLVAIIVIGQISPFPPEFWCDEEGEGFLEYVAGRPEVLEDYE